MIFGLFKSRRNVVEEKVCLCEPTISKVSKSPFELVERLTGKFEHENVALARCTVCSGSALYYSADVYDDFWQYWCKIDEDERVILLAEEDLDEPERPQKARDILLKHAHLVLGPVHGFEWVPPGCPVIEGPPW